MQHLRSAVFESDLQWRCSIILRVMLLQWNVGNVPSRRHRCRANAEFRAQSNDAVHTVSFAEIWEIILTHINGHLWQPLLVLQVWGRMEASGEHEMWGTYQAAAEQRCCEHCQFYWNLYLGNHTSSHKWASMATTSLVLWVWGRMEASFWRNEMWGMYHATA